MWIIRGTVTENEIPVERQVLLYDRTTGALRGQTLSDPSGEYEFQIPESQKDQLHYVAALDTIGGPYNAQIKDYIQPEEV